MIRAEQTTVRMMIQGESLQVKMLTPGRDEGAEERPVLVFLHEALGSIRHWRDFPAQLVARTGLPALLYDRCGFGDSQPLETPRGLGYLEREVATLAALLERCSIERPLLIGHSDGATLALLYAARHPKRPCAVISEAAHLFVEPETLAGIRQAQELWESTDLRQRLARYHGDKVDAVFAAWVDTWLDPSFRNWTIEAEVENVVCPVLALQGGDDQFGTELQLQAIAQRVGGPCQVRTIDECGHSPHREAQAEVLAIMHDFIAELDVLAPYSGFAARL